MYAMFPMLRTAIGFVSILLISYVCELQKNCFEQKNNFHIIAQRET